MGTHLLNDVGPLVGGHVLQDLPRQLWVQLFHQRPTAAQRQLFANSHSRPEGHER
jgi:hypothetical protein